MRIVLRGIDADETPSLWIAAYNGSVKRVVVKLGREEDLEATGSSRKCTALHAAALRGHHLVVEALLAGGANVHAVDIDGLTALQYACSRLKQKAASALINSGADVTEPTNPDYAPVWLAASALLDWDSDPYVTYGDDHKTPTYVQLNEARLKMVNQLISY